MNEINYDGIMIFATHNKAVYMYRSLIQKKIKARLVSAPNKTNASCTQAVKFLLSDIEIVKSEIIRSNIKPKSSFKITKIEEKENYDRISI